MPPAAESWRRARRFFGSLFRARSVACHWVSGSEDLYRLYGWIRPATSEMEIQDNEWRSPVLPRQVHFPVPRSTYIGWRSRRRSHIVGSRGIRFRCPVRSPFHTREIPRRVPPPRHTKFSRGRIFLRENLLLDEAESRSYNSREGKLLLHSSALAKLFSRVKTGGEVLGR